MKCSVYPESVAAHSELPPNATSYCVIAPSSAACKRSRCDASSASPPARMATVIAKTRRVLGSMAHVAGAAVHAYVMQASPALSHSCRRRLVPTTASVVSIETWAVGSAACAASVTASRSALNATRSFTVKADVSACISRSMRTRFTGGGDGAKNATKMHM